MEHLTGKFGRWQILGVEKKIARKVFYLCRCDCGTERGVRKDQLQRGISQSCGCLKKEVASEQIKRLFTRHGMSKSSRAYQIWKGIRKRCMNPDGGSFMSYGGRGISVCKRWDSFENFYADMGEPPEGFSIDRIDVNGNYEPSNCRWADRRTQMNNMRTSLLYRFNGETHSLKEWCRIRGVNYHRVYQRIFRLGWNIDRAFD